MAKKFFKQTTKLNNTVCIYDLETSGIDPYSCEPLEIAAIMVDIQTWTPKENGQFGPILVKPSSWDNVSQKALDVNQLTKEEIMDSGLEQNIAIKQFVDFCRSFAKTSSKWDAPYSGGYNVRGYDNIIMNRMCQEHKYVDKDNSQLLFHPSVCFDLMDLMRFWFFNIDDGPSGYSLTAVCEFFGVKTDNAHEAMADVKMVVTLLKRMMDFHKKLNAKYVDKFKGSFT